MKFSQSEPASAREPRANSNAAILDQLRRIQDSHSFCNSARSKEFLSYVVEHGLKGHEELLKERSIGIHLFQRNPDYITSDDPIVRVKAAEVRRRLAQYYAEEEEAPEVRIEIPVGSYVPKFHWRQPAFESPDPLTSAAPAQDPSQSAPQPLQRSRYFRLWTVWLAAALICMGIAALIFVRLPYRRVSTLDRFWQPLSATKQPLLICVPSPVGYAVSSDLFRESPLAGSGAYSSVARRNSTPLQLDPNTPLRWKDITPLPDFFVNRDDAYAAEDLSSFFARNNRPAELRLGDDYTYEDLRSSPAILVGAYNNPWMGRVMSDLPIGFNESGELVWIEDRTKPGQVWRASTEGRRGTKDFALVVRMLNSKTGQFLVILSGVGMVGTKAAAALISQEPDLETALRGAPDGWERKNIELVIETDIVEKSPSPPRVVAMRVW